MKIGDHRLGTLVIVGTHMLWTIRRVLLLGDARFSLQKLDYTQEWRKARSVASTWQFLTDTHAAPDASGALTIWDPTTSVARGPPAPSVLSCQETARHGRSSGPVDLMLLRSKLDVLHHHTMSNQFFLPYRYLTLCLIVLYSTYHLA